MPKVLAAFSIPARVRAVLLPTIARSTVWTSRSASAARRRTSARLTECLG
jgi:hypothetical protein